MAVNPSQTRIVNKALILLGTTTRVTSISDGTPAAKTFLGLWDEARDEVTADHPWNHALGFSAFLPAAAGDSRPETGAWANAFEMPGDCLRWLPWRRDHEDWFDGEQSGPFILSNAEQVRIRYIRRVEDVGRWSPGFMEALAAKLAYYAAIPITGQAAMQDRMANAYDSALKSAKRQDGLASGQTARAPEYRSDWLAARERPYGA